MSRIVQSFHDRPLLGIAILLTFLSAICTLIVSMYQIGNGAAGTGTWNVLVAAAWVVIGLGLLHRSRTALNWAIACSAINSFLVFCQIVDLQMPLLALLLILQVLVAALLIKERSAFTMSKARMSVTVLATSTSPASTSNDAPSLPSSAVRSSGPGVDDTGTLPRLWRALTQPIYMFGEQPDGGVLTQPVFVCGENAGRRSRRWVLIGVGTAATIAVGVATVIIGRAILQQSRASNSSSISFAEFDAKFGNTSVLGLPNVATVNRTSDQTANERARYLGKSVNWRGIVADVRDDQVVLRHRGVLDRNRPNEVALATAGSERSTVASLSRGDLVEYTGTVKTFGSPYPYTLTNGHIKSSRHLSLEQQMDFMGETDKEAMKLTLK